MLTNQDKIDVNKSALQIHNSIRDKSDFLQIGTSARFDRFGKKSISVTNYLSLLQSMQK